VVAEARQAAPPPAAGREAQRLHRRQAVPHPRSPLQLGQPVIINLTI